MPCGFSFRNLSFTRTAFAFDDVACPFRVIHSMYIFAFPPTSQRNAFWYHRSGDTQTQFEEAFLLCCKCTKVDILVGAPSVALLFSINTDYLHSIDDATTIASFALIPVRCLHTIKHRDWRFTRQVLLTIPSSAPLSLCLLTNSFVDNAGHWMRFIAKRGKREAHERGTATRLLPMSEWITNGHPSSPNAWYPVTESAGQA